MTDTTTKPKLNFTAVNPDGTTVSFCARGRMLWALNNLMHAGEAGCTPIDHPAPRWSHYVWLLRESGVDIETIHEPHGGPFPGTHARYVLRAAVTRDQTPAIGVAA